MESDDRQPGAAEAPNPPGRIARILFALPPREIALFKAIVESYDNLATFRTEDPRRHYVCLYFSAETEPEVRAVLDSLRERFSIRDPGASCSAAKP